MLEAAPADARFDVLLKINTGMNRLGFTPAEFAAVFDRLHRHPRVAQLTLMTHLPMPTTRAGSSGSWSAGAACPGERSAALLANSRRYCVIPRPTPTGCVPASALRCSPFADVSAATLGCAGNDAASELIAVRELQPGERIGYGGVFEAAHPTRVGIVACGYADGYPRHAPTGTPIVVGGQRTRTLGRVSMDMLAPI